MSRKLSVLLWCLLTALALVLTACKGDRGPQGPSGTVPVNLYGSIDYSYSNAEFDLQATGVPSVPSLSVNGVPYQMSFNSYQQVFEYYNHWSPFTPGDSLHLILSYQTLQGNPAAAISEVVLPDTFRLLTYNPDSSYYQILWGQGFDFTWSRSQGAQWYRGYFSIHYNYMDTLGVPGSFYYQVDTVITDTSLVFTAQQLFPEAARIDTLLWDNWAQFNLSALYGPWQEGDLGNVTGDGIGFILCRTYARGVDFHFVNPSPVE
jgi:hypothetical protein